MEAFKESNKANILKYKISRRSLLSVLVLILALGTLWCTAKNQNKITGEVQISIGDRKLNRQMYEVDVLKNDTDYGDINHTNKYATKFNMIMDDDGDMYKIIIRVNASEVPNHKEAVYWMRMPIRYMGYSEYNGTIKIQISYIKRDKWYVRWDVLYQGEHFKNEVHEEIPLHKMKNALFPFQEDVEV